MWDDDGRALRWRIGLGPGAGAGAGGTGPRSVDGTSQSAKPTQPAQPQQPDALEAPAAASLPAAQDQPLPSDPDSLGGLDDLDRELATDMPEVATPAWYRAQARQLIREFLRAVPRSEPDVPLSFVGPDGLPRTLTRAQLSARIDRLRPRQRQIIRLSVEERWPRQRVCSYLSHISYKTLERDQVEALDILAQMEEVSDTHG